MLVGFDVEISIDVEVRIDIRNVLTYLNNDESRKRLIGIEILIHIAMYGLV